MKKFEDSRHFFTVDDIRVLHKVSPNFLDTNIFYCRMQGNAESKILNTEDISYGDDEYQTKINLTRLHDCMIISDWFVEKLPECKSGHNFTTIEIWTYEKI